MSIFHIINSWTQGSFKAQPLHVGSYYSHLKVSRADEFDYSVVLDTPSLAWTSGTPAYYGGALQPVELNLR
jgi:hypothetical protein